MKLVDITGMRFGRLLVLHRAGSLGKQAAWLCLCDCGKETVKAGVMMRAGHVASCGCLKQDVVAAGANTRHGMRRTSTYRVWCGMKSRCYSPTTPAYKDYGGRGITICDRWRESFSNFLADMGEKPAGKTLDRKDNGGPYSPENCRWSTSREQSNNTRRNVRIEFNGRTMSVSEWARETGIERSTLRSRLSKGWSIEQALTAPVDEKKKPLSYR